MLNYQLSGSADHRSLSMSVYRWVFLFSCAMLWSCSEEDELCNCVVPQPGVAQVTTIDMGDPYEYELVPYPSHYGQAQNTDNVPADNPITNEGASLGRVLFYDTELSQNRTISCASCHVQSLGFTDSAQFSTGYLGGKTAFHSMRLGNGRFYAPGLQFWDRRSISLEDQSTQPIQDHIEMGFDSANGGIDALIQRLDGLLYYRELFEWVFGDALITEDRIQKALGQFVRSMVSYDSRFDQGYAQTFDPSIPGVGLLADFPNFSEDENEGKRIFMTPARLGGAGCNDCHQAPAFTLDGPVLSNGLIPGETRIFKAPSLKNIGLTGPFMHGGQLPDLLSVIEHYDSGVKGGPALDPLLRDPANHQPLRLNLTDREKFVLLSFLLTLDDPTLTTDQKFSDPFRR